MFETIVVPLDGSVVARQAIPHLAKLASAFGSKVVLLTICEPEEKDYADTCMEYMGQESASLESALGARSRTRTVVSVGKPAEEIVEFAEKNAVSLIIISSHGRSGLATWPLGSTVDRVLRMTGVPTLLLRSRDPQSPAEGQDLFGRILVPLDGTPNGEAAMAYVETIARNLGSEVILLRVAAAGRHVRSIGGLDYVPYKDIDVAAAKEAARQYLDGLASRLKSSGITVRSVVTPGDPAQETIKLAEDLACSLIAMSTHAHSSIERWFHGSISYKVLQASKQSVLLIKA